MARFNGSCSIPTENREYAFKYPPPRQPARARVSGQLRPSTDFARARTGCGPPVALARGELCAGSGDGGLAAGLSAAPHAAHPLGTAIAVGNNPKPSSRRPAGPWDGCSRIRRSTASRSRSSARMATLPYSWFTRAVVPWHRTCCSDLLMRCPRTLGGRSRAGLLQGHAPYRIEDAIDTSPEMTSTTFWRAGRSVTPVQVLENNVVLQLD